MNNYLWKIYVFLALYVPITAISCDESQVKEQPKYRFEKIQPGDEFAGIYNSPLAHTVGESLYIFPDGKFALTFNCDICIEEETLAKGTYTRLGSSIKLKYSSPFKGQKEKVYYLRHGYEEYEEYVQGESNSPLLLDDLQFSEINSADSFFAYLHRTTPYPNWKRKSAKLLSRKIKRKDSL